MFDTATQTHQFTNPFVVTLHDPEKVSMLSSEGRNALDTIYEGRIVSNAVAARIARITKSSVRVITWDAWVAETEAMYEAAMEAYTHTCVMRETPDGYGCAECLYS